MNKLWKQKGYNCLWPYEIHIWEWGNQPIPDWLSDRAKVIFIDGEGNKTLCTRELSNGGVEIIKAEGVEALVRLKNKTDLVYFPLPSIGFSKFPSELDECPWPKTPCVISRKQLELLYEPI